MEFPQVMLLEVEFKEEDKKQLKQVTRAVFSNNF